VRAADPIRIALWGRPNVHQSTHDRFRRSRRWLRRRRDERGETLIESLVTITIIAAGVVALTTAMGDNFRFSQMSREAAQADALLYSWEERIQGLTYENCTINTTPYANTAAGAYPVLPGLTLTAPGNAHTSQEFAMSVDMIAFWDGSSAPAGWTQSCSSGDPGAQQITISASSGDGLVTRSLTFVKRRP
jgi:Tfp pilus assembly protein PilV